MGRTGRKLCRDSHPVRTCVGCRQRAAKVDLLRVVAEPCTVIDSTAEPADTDAVPVSGAIDNVRLDIVTGAHSGSWIVVPDPDAQRPGRGAYLHPSDRCLELAERRRAFPRRLRVAGPVDLERLRDHLAARSDHGPIGSNATTQTETNRQRTCNAVPANGSGSSGS